MRALHRLLHILHVKEKKTCLGCVRLDGFGSEIGRQNFLVFLLRLLVLITPGQRKRPDARRDWCCWR